ncbi:MAG TPA: biopolymer transporter ExbD, partial [Nitrospiria bacterium]|nr:biopolymer transporter ExbD [Nitrospiria bacterium]
TILILFLLFHLAGGGDVLPPAKNIQLPESLSEQAPKPTVTIMVTPDDVSVEGKWIGMARDFMDSEKVIIPALLEELKEHAALAKSVGEVTGVDVFEGKITIVGDQSIPFRLLEKIMFTCSEAEFPDIHLAVLQKESA